MDPDTDNSQSQSDEDANSQRKQPGWVRKSLNPFRIATLRGLAVVLPPLLTIILFFWAWNTIEQAVFQPVESIATYFISWSVADTLEDKFVQKEIASSPRRGRISTQDSRTVFISENGQAYCKIKEGGESWIPFVVFDHVQNLPESTQLQSPGAYYNAYIKSRFLKRHLVIPAFIAAFIACMYIIGKLMAAGIGRILWHYFERLIERLPIIRNVYSSVKQVTDFAFSSNEIQFNRVVAVEYPRKGIWSMGFVTGESMLDMKNASGEPMLSVLMPTSPMPATGFIISIPKSETIDLDITIDQAIQFCVSCGVVVPEHQQPRAVLEAENRRQISLQATSDQESNVSKPAGPSDQTLPPLPDPGNTRSAGD